MIYNAPEDKMIKAAPSSKGWHISGSGIWKPAYILAETIEEAEKIWHATKQLIEAITPVGELPNTTATTPPPTPEKPQSTTPPVDGGDEEVD